MKQRAAHSLCFIALQPQASAFSFQCRRFHAYQHPFQLVFSRLNHTSLTQWISPERASLSNKRLSSSTHGKRRSSHKPKKPAAAAKPEPKTAPAIPSKAASHFASIPMQSPPKTSSAVYSLANPQTFLNNALNPPDETYPPPISIPPRKPSQSRLRYLLNCGRAYLSFYKAGISRTRSNAKLAKKLRKKRAEDGDKVITRAEWQIIKRSRNDMLRLPIMGLLILLMGEWLPLVVIFMNPIIPEPCRIPKQIERALRKREKRKHERFRRIGIDSARLVAMDRKLGASLQKGDGTDQLPRQLSKLGEGDVKELSYLNLIKVSAKLDAHPFIFERLFIPPPKWLLRYGIGRKLLYLRKDDDMIAKWGGWAALDKEEVKRACIERGIDVVGKTEGEMRTALGTWFGGAYKGVGLL